MTSGANTSSSLNNPQYMEIEGLLLATNDSIDRLEHMLRSKVNELNGSVEEVPSEVCPESPDPVGILPTALRKIGRLNNRLNELERVLTQI